MKLSQRKNFEEQMRRMRLGNFMRYGTIEEEM